MIMRACFYVKWIIGKTNLSIKFPLYLLRNSIPIKEILGTKEGLQKFSIFNNILENEKNSLFISLFKPQFIPYYLF